MNLQPELDFCTTCQGNCTKIEVDDRQESIIIMPGFEEKNL